MSTLDTIQASWFLWLSSVGVLVLLLRFLGKNRRTEVQPGMATKSDQFSMRTVFLSFRSGEAGLFFTVLAILANCFLFALAISHEIYQLVQTG
ncbi:MAG: hypothetical protein RRB13_02275 [bacterium]|nr:hypothetical protein [bacterium]